ncbi:MAG: hypothetical protein H5U02_11645 [Clostridia bacterium]|nr:hypothetical protein [Clostridia bacterium]
MAYPDQAEELGDLLTDAEVTSIVRNFLQTRGKEGATDQEILRVLSEVCEWKISGLIFQMVVEGTLTVNLKDGRVLVGSNPVLSAGGVANNKT